MTTPAPRYAGSVTPLPTFLGHQAPAHTVARATARWIAIAAFLLYAITGGGRIVGSDEVTMLELARAMLHRSIAVPVGATLDGPDGRHYTKNAAGQAVLALPLVATAELAAMRAPVAPAKRTLAVRFAVSFFNAAVTALLLAVFYRASRYLGLRAKPALAATVLLAFTTPVWVYAKSFMAEPLQALGLLLALEGSARAAGAGGAPGEGRAGWIAALGVALAISVKLSMLPLALICLWPMRRAKWTVWLAPAIGLALALAGHAVYDVARFGTPFETGYGKQATPMAYTTPILTGLYGLLLSSGKGIAWFAPVVWLAPVGAVAAWRIGGTERRTVTAALAACALAVLLYAKFEHWAGDGSFGPRYLVPILPLALVAVAFALDRCGAAVRALAVVLAIAGFAVQIGGVGIYFGAQMREAGDYPYTRALNDPQFMHESHFVPSHSPILGHWRMLIRNAREAFQHGPPKLTGAGAVDPRTGVSAEDAPALLHSLDFWWAYAPAAGVPKVPVFAALLVLVLLAGWAGIRALACAEIDALSDAAAP